MALTQPAREKIRYLTAQRRIPELKSIRYRRQWKLYFRSIWRHVEFNYPNSLGGYPALTNPPIGIVPFAHPAKISSTRKESFLEMLPLTWFHSHWASSSSPLSSWGKLDQLLDQLLARELLSLATKQTHDRITQRYYILTLVLHCLHCTLYSENHQNIQRYRSWTEILSIVVAVTE